MACSDKPNVQRAVARPGDRCQVWLENCSPAYLHSGRILIVHANGQSHTGNVLESDLDQGAPFTYVYRPGEFFSISLLFDPVTGPGKQAEVHARVITSDGAERDRWCTRIVSGTPAPDTVSFALKGAQ
ncbi:MAG: hypothetical protein AB1941_24490 [Gemmatimonadota bacterium]